LEKGVNVFDNSFGFQNPNRSIISGRTIRESLKLNPSNTASNQLNFIPNKDRGSPDANKIFQVKRRKSMNSLANADFYDSIFECEASISSRENFKNFANIKAVQDEILQNRKKIEAIKSLNHFEENQILSPERKRLSILPKNVSMIQIENGSIIAKSRRTLSKASKSPNMSKKSFSPPRARFSRRQPHSARLNINRAYSEIGFLTSRNRLKERKVSYLLIS
jgi:hypothetical protein